MKLLYIENELTIALPVLKILEKKGFEIDHFTDGIQGLNQAINSDYDCLILDLNLPGMDGIAITKKLRSLNIQTPILMLTARTSLDDKVTGFDIGADDYLTKPFEILELTARIKSLIKRTCENKNLELILDDLKINVDQNQILDLNHKTTTSISSKEMGVLEYLLRHKGKVISSEELLEHVWDSNINSFTATVKTHMKTLRKKLGLSANKIQTIKGKGYIIE